MFQTGNAFVELRGRLRGQLRGVILRFFRSLKIARC